MNADQISTNRRNTLETVSYRLTMISLFITFQISLTCRDLILSVYPVVIGVLAQTKNRQIKTDTKQTHSSLIIIIIKVPRHSRESVHHASEKHRNACVWCIFTEISCYSGCRGDLGSDIRYPFSVCSHKTSAAASRG